MRSLLLVAYVEVAFKPIAHSCYGIFVSVIATIIFIIIAVFIFTAESVDLPLLVRGTTVPPMLKQNNSSIKPSPVAWSWHHVHVMSL